ncbi:hypothetical protein C8J56DRAFT_892346 [Mycena floridula]|nr:hypothetical protein C8J56DRAFT_892346 [Mycena floridula]
MNQACPSGVLGLLLCSLTQSSNLERDSLLEITKNLCDSRHTTTVLGAGKFAPRYRKAGYTNIDICCLHELASKITGKLGENDKNTERKYVPFTMLTTGAIKTDDNQRCMILAPSVPSIHQQLIKTPELQDESMTRIDQCSIGEQWKPT